MKPKDLIGIPWMVAFALRADGWWLRKDNIWSKPNCMPESVDDRTTSSHEYVFHLSKSERYYYDAAAIGEDLESGPSDLKKMRESGDRYGGKQQDAPALHAANPLSEIGRKRAVGGGNGKRNARSVWTIATVPYSGAHFATFPPELAEKCILAGSSAKACESCGAPWERVVGEKEPAEGRGSGNVERLVASSGERSRLDTHLGPWQPTTTPTVGWRPTCDCDKNAGIATSVVLDPFGGSGTTAAVAVGHGRSAIYIDLSPANLELARHRIGPFLCEEGAA